MMKRLKELVPTIALVLLITTVLCCGALCLSGCLPANQVAKRMLDGDNIIHNYEWFHDANQAILAKQADITSYRDLVANTRESDARARAIMELNAMQMSCRGLVSDYNANSSKVNRNIFKGTSTPDRIDLSVCE